MACPAGMSPGFGTACARTATGYGRGRVAGVREAGAMRDRQWVRQNGAAISDDRSGPARAKQGVQRKLVVGPADDAFEREADVVAAKVIAGLYSGAIGRGGGALQRSAQPGSAVGAEGGEVSGATASRIRPSGNDRLDA